MLEPFRTLCNNAFTDELYHELLERLDAATGTHVAFRVAETPCFFSPSLLEEMIGAGIELTKQLLENPDYMRRSSEAIPADFKVRRESAKPHFMTVDFGLVRSEDGRLRPKLVEMQAFPSIFGYQPLLAEEYRRMYRLDPELESLFAGLDDGAYWKLLGEVILGSHPAENVVLLEVDPFQQKTLPDFLMHQKKLGIAIVDVTQVVQQGRKLFYSKEGMLTPIHRIYNRVIVDELERKQIRLPFNYGDDLDVEWAGHPNWYFRISKFSIPYLQHETVPKAVFLDDFFARPDSHGLPKDRRQWVLKPLYSFAGKGIQFEPSEGDLLSIPVEDRRKYLLQERVQFEPVIRTPAGMTQAEIRILYVWPDGREMIPMTSLVRMGRGLMMGVDHNRDRTWVGGSAGFFPKR